MFTHGSSMTTTYRVRGLSDRLRHPGLFAVILFTMVALCSGCARPINRTAERHIREALPQLLGSARRYEVRVDGDPYNTVHGRLARIRIDATDLMLPSGLLLAHLHLDLHGVVYDMHRHQLVSVTNTTFRAEIGQDSLNLAFAGLSPPGADLRDLNLSLYAGNIINVTGKRMVLGVGVPFSVTGNVVLSAGTSVQFRPDEARIVGLPIPEIVVSFLARHFSSAIDLSSLNLPMNVETVITSPQTLMLKGTVDVSRWTVKAPVR